MSEPESGLECVRISYSSYRMVHLIVFVNIMQRSM